MSQIKVEGPDGLVVYFPTGTSAEKINEVMEVAYRERLRMQPPQTSEFMRDVVGRIGLGQGVAIGAGDEAEARARASIGGEDYDAALKATRDQIATARRERPIAAPVAEAIGSLAPAVAAVASAPLTGGASTNAALPTLARSSTLFGNMLRGGVRGAAIGGGQGVIEGFMKGEGGFENRALNATKEGTVGGIVGGALGSAIPGVGSLYRSFRQPPATRAQDRMLDVLAEDGLTPQRLAAQYTQSQATGVKPEIPADLLPGSSLAQETRRVYNTPGANRAEMGAQLQRRMDDQGARVQGEFQDAMGEGRRFYPVLEDLEQARKVDADPIYKAIHPRPARSQTMDQLLTRAPDEAFEEARRAARYDGLDFPDIVGVGRNGQRAVAFDYTLKDVDLVKRGLDRVIEKNTDPVTGKVNSEGRRAMTLKSAIVGEADKLVPEYAQARSAWAGPSAVMDAMRKGQQLFNERAEVTARDIARLGVSEKEGFLIGALDAVNQRLGRKIEGEDMTRAFRSGNAKKQIESALLATGRKPDEVKAIADNLFTNVEREAQISATTRGLRSISQTMPLMAQDQAFQQGMTLTRGAINDVRQGGVSGALAGMAQRAGDALALGVGETKKAATNAELQRYLFASNPAEVGAAMAELQKRAAMRGRYAPQRARIPGLLADPATDYIMP